MKKLDIKSLRKRLTIRYAIALSIIAFLLLLSFFFISNRLSMAELDAKTINKSGLQRMLSKTIALQATLTVHNLNIGNTIEKPFKILKGTKSAFVNGHRGLVNSLSTPSYGKDLKLKNYYLDSGGLEDQVEEFILEVDKFIDLVERRAPLANLNTSLDEIVGQATGPLIQNLNTAVGLFQKVAEARVAQFKQFEKMIISLGLLTLLLEAFLIFRPMVDMIISGIKGIDQKNNELTTFTYRLSHDVRAPVASSLGLIEIAIEGAEENDSEAQIGALNLIKKGMIRLDTLIHDILELTKTRIGELKVSKFSLKVLVEEVLDSLQNFEGFSETKFTQNLELDEIQTDSRILQQTLLNLVSNAIKYRSPERNLEITISSGTLPGGGYLVSIEDNGLGIPAGKRNDLFTMFKRFHPKAAIGSGLGLYLVRQNAIALGGDVSYIPKEEGSKFTVTASKGSV